MFRNVYAESSYKESIATRRADKINFTLPLYVAVVMAFSTKTMKFPAYNYPLDRRY